MTEQDESFTVSVVDWKNRFSQSSVVGWFPISLTNFLYIQKGCVRGAHGMRIMFREYQERSLDIARFPKHRAGHETGTREH